MVLHCFCPLLHGLDAGALLCLLVTPGIAYFPLLPPKKVNWILGTIAMFGSYLVVWFCP